MPLFNNSAIAASFKTSSIQNTPDIANTGSEKMNWNGVETRKTELVKELMPIGVTALRLVFPMTSNNYIRALNEATTEQALEAILGILENQEEDIALVGKQEWMQSWPKHTNPISDINEIAQDTLTNYFQQGSEKVGGNIKEIWRFALAGSSNMANLLKLTKATINRCQWCITININYFAKINYYFAGWLSGADTEVLQLTDTGNAIRKGMEKIKPESIKVEEDEVGSDPLPHFGIQTIRYTATVTGRTKNVIAHVHDHQLSEKFDEIVVIDHNDKGRLL
jgi:hypothetical protein